MSSIVDDILNEKMREKKTLQQYATLRKLPEVINLGNIWESERLLFLEFVDETPISNERAIKNRTGTYGVEHDYSTPAGKTYNQRHIDNFDVSIKCLYGFIDMFDWRYAELEKKSTIPEHLDNPFNYRLLIMLKGEHEYKSKKNKVTMSEGQVWFINSAYHHSVINNTNEKRIALLGKMNINENNTQLLRIRAGK